MSRAVIDTVLRLHAGRFVGDGVPLPDLEQLTREITNWERWFEAWTRVGDRYARLAAECEAEGATVSAGEFFWQASLFHHYGQFLWFHDPPVREKGQRRKVEMYNRAAPYLIPPAERLEIPNGPWRIPAFLRLPPGERPTPCVILLGGLESTKEESLLFENMCLRRGLATLAFDGPGQGEMFFQVRFRADFELFTSTVVDYLHTRPEIDAGRIGILGRSLGGHLAVRSAALERRLRACVAWGSLYDLRHWDSIPELTRRGFVYIAGLADPEEAREFYRTAVDLEGVAQRMRCPLYVLHGARDEVLPGDHVERLRAATARVDQTFVVMPEGNHCCHNLYPVVRPRMADWLASKLRS